MKFSLNAGKFTPFSILLLFVESEYRHENALGAARRHGAARLGPAVEHRAAHLPHNICTP